MREKKRVFEPTVRGTVFRDLDQHGGVLHDVKTTSDHLNSFRANQLLHHHAHSERREPGDVHPVFRVAIHRLLRHAPQCDHIYDRDLRREQKASSVLRGLYL